VHYILTTFCDIGADAAINARQRWLETRRVPWI
jgi:hypothetical protein